MTEEQRLEPGAAAQLAMNTLTAQIQAIIASTSGSTKLQAESLQTLLVSNMQLITEASNAQVDDYNAIYDELECRDKELLAQASVVVGLRAEIETINRETIGVMQGRIDEAESARLDAVTELGREKVGAAALRTRIHGVESELKKLKQLDPEGTRKRLKEKQALLDEQRKALAELRSANLKLKSAHADDTKRIAELCALLEEAQAEIDGYRDGGAAKEIWSRHLNKRFTTSGGEQWYAYVLQDGLQAYGDDIINDLDWKLILMNSLGLGCAVMITKWCAPVIQVSDFTRQIPDELVSAMNDFIREALEQTHPLLLERRDHFKSVSITELEGIKPKLLVALEDAGLLTVADLLICRPAMLTKVPGIGDATANQIYQAATAMALAYELQQEQKEAA